MSPFERNPQAAVRSPESLWEELETLDVVLELEMKLALR